MGIAFLMKIVKAIHHLVEIGPRDPLGEFAGVGNKVKEFSSTNVLQDDGEAVVGSLILLLVSCVFTDADEFDQILMVKLLHDVEFMLESLKSGSFLLILFDGHESSLFILAKLDSVSKKEYCAWYPAPRVFRILNSSR